MRLDLAIVQDVGKRSEQQDSATAHGLPAGNGVMLVVADGLGGHVGGATASRLAIETFAEATQTGAFDAHADRRRTLAAALQGANQRIAEASTTIGPKETMGTTLISAVVADGAVRWISVGDSHLYLWRNGTLSKLNQDHSQAGLMVASGRFKPDDKELDAYRSLLRSALTGRNIELIDDPESEHAIAPGDVILLSSDGLNTIDVGTITAIVAEHRSNGAELLAARLIAAVRQHDLPNQDNTSVIVAMIDPVEEPKTALTGPPTTPHQQPSTPDDARTETTAVVTTPVLAGTEDVRERPNGAPAAKAVRPARALRADPQAPTAAPPRPASSRLPIIIVLALAALALGGYFAYQALTPAAPTAPTSAPTKPAPTAPRPAQPASAPPAAPAPQPASRPAAAPTTAPATTPQAPNPGSPPQPSNGARPGPVSAPPPRPTPPPPAATQPAAPQPAPEPRVAPSEAVRPGQSQTVPTGPPAPAQRPVALPPAQPLPPQAPVLAPGAPQQLPGQPSQQQPVLAEPPRPAVRPPLPDQRPPGPSAPVQPQPSESAPAQPAPPVGSGGMQTGQQRQP